MPEAPPPLSPPKSFPETAQEIESRIRQQYNEQMEAAKREWAEVSRQQGARVQAEVSAEANKRLRMAEDRLRSEYGQRLKDERAKMQMAAEAAFERSRVEWESERRRQAQEPSNRKKTRADHENILGIIRPYTRVELTRKYREKAAKCHPDKVMHLDAELQKVAERLMKDLNAARDFLADHCSP